MRTINVNKFTIIQGNIKVLTLFSSFIIKIDQIKSILIMKIPSLFDEICIVIKEENDYIITERLENFFIVAEILNLNNKFGINWYSEAESGKILEHQCN